MKNEPGQAGKKRQTHGILSRDVVWVSTERPGARKVLVEWPLSWAL